MGITNTRLNLENNVARWKGEREAKQSAIEKIEAGMALLESLRHRVAKLDALLAAAETVTTEDNPNWSSEAIKPRAPTDKDSSIPFGMLGRTALEVLREAPPEGLPARIITREVIKRFGGDPADRKLLDKKTNSLSNYLKANEGDLVESDGAEYYKRWRLIR